MKAIGNYLVVKDAPAKVNKTEGGLELTNKHEDVRYIDAEVISVGNNVKGIENNNNILYDKVGGHNVVIKGVVYKVIRDRDVVGVHDY